MQRFDHEAAVTLANVFNGNTSALGKLWDMLRGRHKASAVPVYVGHPDLDPKAYRDHSAKGWVKAARALGNGLELDVEWTPEGRALVDSKAFKSYSPYWDAVPVGLANSRIYRPARLISVGLTNNHRMPVRPLSNSEDKPAEADPNSPEAQAASGLQGEAETVTDPAGEPLNEEPASILQAVRLALKLTPEAGRDALLSALTTMADAAERLPAVEAARNAAVTELEATRAQATQGQQDAQAHDAARQAAVTVAEEATTLANTLRAEGQQLREAYLTERLTALQGQGLITPASYNGTLGRLMALANVEAITSELATLSKAAVTLPTEPAPGVAAAAAGKPTLATLANDAGTGKGTHSARVAYIGEVQAALQAQGVSISQSYSLAWERLRRERPDLLP